MVTAIAIVLLGLMLTLLPPPRRSPFATFMTEAIVEGTPTEILAHGRMVGSRFEWIDARRVKDGQLVAVAPWDRKRICREAALAS